MSRRIAVVLFNLGGPDRIEAVQPFLFNLFNDGAIIKLPQPFRWLTATLISNLRKKTAQAIYAQMGGRSPLLEETEAQRSALQIVLDHRLPDATVKTMIAMRYWKPFTTDALREVDAFAPNEIVLLPLYPHYSTTTTGSSFKEWRRLYRGQAKIHSVCCYPDDLGLTVAHAQKITEILGGRNLSDMRLVFSAHGLPESIIAAGDPYQGQIERSAAILAERIGVADWRVCYQSRVGPMKWIGPSTIETIEQAGRDKKAIVVVPIAFVSEHSETLVELDLEYRELAERSGVPLYLRAPAIGVEPAFISALGEIVAAALTKSGVCPGGGVCDASFEQCPFRQASAA
jgi:ferrochelatase